MTANIRHAVDLLKGEIRDLQRPNLFEVEIDISGILSANQASSKFAGLSFDGKESYSIAHKLIQGVNIPSSSLGTVDIKRMGRKLTLPTDVNFSEDVQLTLLNDVEGKAKRFFTDWQKMYYLSIGSQYTNNLGNYVTGGKVRLFSLDGWHTRTSYTLLYNAFPRLVGELSFSHENDNQLSTFTVSIAFSNASYNIREEVT